MEKVYRAEFAGHPVRYAFLHQETRKYFKFRVKAAADEDYDIKATPERVARAQQFSLEHTTEAYAEYKALLSLTSAYLSRYRCCIFHATAFLWRGRAWLLTAPSGTGKTTQFLNWRKLHPAEITMISGDMPVLELRDDGSVMVHSSCWNGKEGVGSLQSAPLGGTILLEQGKENRIGSLSVREAIPALFGQFISEYETEDQIRAVCALMDGMLSRYPAWKLVNLGDDASTELLRSVIAEETGGNDGTV